MPAKPTWLPNLDNVLAALRAHPHPTVDRATLELLLGVSRRRAQQIMAPCVTVVVGSNGLADRERLIAHLDQLARNGGGSYELRRRRRVVDLLERLRTERIEQPRLLVEAPTAVINQEIASLPDGVRLTPGKITVEFSDPQQALEKLLALAMAISNDFERFERLTA